MDLQPEIQAAIIKVAGKWAKTLVLLPGQDLPTVPQLSVAKELEKWFVSEYRFLAAFVEKEASNPD